MNSFADIQKISSYSVALGEKLCADYYSRNSVVTGPDIKNFTSIEQINLFIFKNLFEKWQDETNRLKSPYFDYSIEPVQDALKRLLNTLSNHIAITKEFFKPILFKAIEDTLLLALHPLQFIENELSSISVVRKGHFQNTSKFFKVNRSVLSAVDEAFDSKEELKKEELIEFLKTKEFKEEQTRDVVEALSQLIQIELNDVHFEPLIKEEPKSADEETHPESTGKTVVEEAETKEPKEPTKEETAAQAEVVPREEPVQASTESEAEEPKETVELTSTSSPKTEPEKPKAAEQVRGEEAETVQANIEQQKTAEQEVTSLNDRFVRKEVTLNDLLAKTAAGQIEPKITDLRSAVSLSEKFIYIKELFGDDPASYAVAISEIEKVSGLEEALNLLKLKYAPKYNWDFNSNQVKDFVRLVERRFS